MKLLEGAVSVSVYLDVVEDVVFDLEVSQALRQNFADERMTSLVDVVKDLVNLGILCTFIFLVLKAAQLFHQIPAGKHMIGRGTREEISVVIDVVQDRIEMKTDRKEGQVLPLDHKLFVMLRQAETCSTA